MTRPEQAIRLCSLLLLAALAVACASDDDNAPVDAGTDALAPPAPLTAGEIEQACVRMAACGVKRQARLGDCINTYNDKLVRAGGRELYDRAFACVNQGAGDCKAIRECMGFAGKPKDNCDTSYVPRCEGDVAYNCDLLSKWEQKLDCSLGGLKCAVKKGESGDTTEAVCGGGECDPNEVKKTCRNNQLWQCVGGAFEIQDCPADGMQCRDPVAAVCEGTGRSCPGFAPECRGNTIVKCQNGYVYELECPKTRKCDPTNAICVAAGSECSTDSFFDQCANDKIEVCIDGFKKTFDCKQLGFEGCEENRSGHGDFCKAAPVYDD